MSRGIMASIISYEGRHRRSALVAGALLATAACRDLDESDEDCESLGICVDVVEPDPRWDCLAEEPVMPGLASGMFAVYGLPVLEWGLRTPLAGAGLTALLCAGIDPECNSPAAMPQPLQIGMVAGMPVEPFPGMDLMALIGMRPNFDGLIRFEVLEDPPRPADQQFLPTVYFLGGPVVDQTMITPLGILMVRRGTLESIVDASFANGDIQTPVDLDTRGIVVLRAINCLGQEAEDVYFEIDRDGVVPFTLPQNRVPIPGTPGEPTYTDSLGVGGFVNVPPGLVRVQAFRRDAETPFGTANFYAVAGEVSAFVIRPPVLNTATLPRPQMMAAE